MQQIHNFPGLCRNTGTRRWFIVFVLVSINPMNRQNNICWPAEVQPQTCRENEPCYEPHRLITVSRTKVINMEKLLHPSTCVFMQRLGTWSPFLRLPGGWGCWTSSLLEGKSASNWLLSTRVCILSLSLSFCQRAWTAKLKMPVCCKKAACGRPLLMLEDQLVPFSMLAVALV